MFHFPFSSLFSMKINFLSARSTVCWSTWSLLFGFDSHCFIVMCLHISVCIFFTDTHRKKHLCQLIRFVGMTIIMHSKMNEELKIHILLIWNLQWSFLNSHKAGGWSPPTDYWKCAKRNLIISRITNNFQTDFILISSW